MTKTIFLYVRIEFYFHGVSEAIKIGLAMPSKIIDTMGNENNIAPGLNRVVGNGSVNDSGAIQTYLDSLCTHNPADTPVSLPTGCFVHSGGSKVRVTYPVGQFHSFSFNNTVTILSLGDANFPAGDKVITGVGGTALFNTRYRYTTFTYAETPIL